METPNRVWIELELPREKKGKPIDHLLGHARAALADKMLQRLGCDAGYVHWSERDFCYCFGGQNGYVVAADNGHWFNLDTLGS